MDNVDRETGEIIVPFFRTAYNYDRNAVSRETALVCKDASRTKQSFKDETDINNIVRRFGLTGELPTSLKVPTYEDFSAVVDFQSAMNIVIRAEKAFAEMPADVRRRFDNDPGKFMAFVHDDANKDEARKLGLLVPEPSAPVPTLVKVVPEEPAQ